MLESLKRPTLNAILIGLIVGTVEGATMASEPRIPLQASFVGPVALFGLIGVPVAAFVSRVFMQPEPTWYGRLCQYVFPTLLIAVGSLAMAAVIAAKQLFAGEADRTLYGFTAIYGPIGVGFLIGHWVQRYGKSPGT